MRGFGWRQANYLMAAVIIIIDGYIDVSPVLPQLDLWRRRHASAAVAGLPYQTKLDKNSSTENKRNPTPTDDRLVIPVLAIDQKILSGKNPYIVNLGVWARPNTSTPPKGSNTVLVAHRFTYKGPSIFYSLGNLKKGDKVVVYWSGKEYDYTVNASRIVDGTDLSVEGPTKQAELTLYTCTPLWTAHPQYRIVVTALPDGGDT
jgi:LPXTG-site transpeptidase (sortase) family protein